MELCATGITLDNLGCHVSSKCVDALHGIHLPFHHLLFPQVVDT